MVFDSSAVLALLNDEPGSDVVRNNLAKAVICTINLSEIVARVARSGESIETIRYLIDILDLDTVDFDRALAEETGMLIQKTAQYGLSLGDRACLALAARSKQTVLTADSAWRNVDVGVEIQLIR